METDSRSDDLEKRNHLLEGEVADLQQNLKEQSQADEHVMALMNAKTKEWQVSCDPPASSSSLSVLCSSFLPLDLRAWQKYILMTLPLAVSLSAPSALFFFIRSCSVKNSQLVYLSLEFIVPLSLSSLCLLSLLQQDTLFNPSLYHFSLSLPQSLLSAKESELQECQGRLAQLEEQLRAAQTGADRATIVRMKQVSF